MCSSQCVRPHFSKTSICAWLDYFKFICLLKFWKIIWCNAYVVTFNFIYKNSFNHFSFTDSPNKCWMNNKCFWSKWWFIDNPLNQLWITAFSGDNNPIMKYSPNKLIQFFTKTKFISSPNCRFYERKSLIELQVTQNHWH